MKKLMLSTLEDFEKNKEKLRSDSKEISLQLLDEKERDAVQSIESSRQSLDCEKTSITNNDDVRQYTSDLCVDTSILMNVLRNFRGTSSNVDSKSLATTDSAIEVLEPTSYSNYSRDNCEIEKLMLSTLENISKNEEKFSLKSKKIAVRLLNGNERDTEQSIYPSTQSLDFPKTSTPNNHDVRQYTSDLCVDTSILMNVLRDFPGTSSDVNSKDLATTDSAIEVLEPTFYSNSSRDNCEIKKLMLSTLENISKNGEKFSLKSKEIAVQLLNGNDRDTEQSNYSRTKPLNFEKFFKKINDDVRQYTSNLYANTKIPRSLADEIMKKTVDLQNSIFTEALCEWKCSADCFSNLKFLHDTVLCTFGRFKTPHRVMTVFDILDCFIRPSSKTIAYSLKKTKKNKTIKLGPQELKIEVISMKAVLVEFLGLPNVFKAMVDTIREAKAASTLISPLQGSIWKDIEQKFGDKMVLPLLLYHDDFEINNPLGTHRGVHKIGAIYFSIPIIPAEFRGTLDNIFLAQLHNSVDFKKVDSKVILADIVRQLKDLESNGITINLEDGEKKIYFSLLSVVGDNLSQNEILGMTSSFNSEYCCRFCIASKSQRQELFEEEIELLRVNNDHANDVKEKEHNVITECALDELENYMGIKNASVDPMHDLLEGVWRYIFGHLLSQFIYVDGFFSLETLNNRIQSFQYEKHMNVPPPITKSNIKNRYVVLSASEMEVFVMYFGFYIGDKVPETNQQWKLYLLLREITRLVMSASITSTDISNLSSLISNFTSLSQQLFPGSLKPKFHHLIHYPRIITLLGPPRFYSAIRYEAKHRDLKNAAKTTECRVNPPRTLAINHQLTMSDRLLQRKGLSSRFSHGPLIEEALNNLPDYNDFSNIIPLCLIDRHIVPSWVSIYGTRYETGASITLEAEKNELPLFGEIKYMTVTHNEEIFFIYKNLTTLGMWEHGQGYQIKETSIWGCVAQKELVNYKPQNIHILPNGNNYILNI